MKFLDEYMRQATRGLWIQPYTDPMAHCALGLAGEAGEIADMIKKSQYDPERTYHRIDLALELGDVFWYATNLANQHGFELEQIFRMNIDKLSKRHPTKGVYDVNKL